MLVMCWIEEIKGLFSGVFDSRRANRPYRGKKVDGVSGHETCWFTFGFFEASFWTALLHIRPNLALYFLTLQIATNMPVISCCETAQIKSRSVVNQKFLTPV